MIIVGFKEKDIIIIAKLEKQFFFQNIRILNILISKQYSELSEKEE